MTTTTTEHAALWPAEDVSYWANRMANLRRPWKPTRTAKLYEPKVYGAGAEVEFTSLDGETATGQIWSAAPGAHCVWVVTADRIAHKVNVKAVPVEVAYEGGPTKREVATVEPVTVAEVVEVDDAPRDGMVTVAQQGSTGRTLRVWRFTTLAECQAWMAQNGATLGEVATLVATGELRYEFSSYTLVDSTGESMQDPECLNPAVVAAERAAADSVVSDRTRERIEASVPENTKRAYSRQLARFEAWCAQAGRTAYPATGETLAEYVSHLCDLELGPASIDQAITAIRSQHRNMGFEHQPDTRAARMVLKTHRRERSAAGQRAHKAPVVTIERLRAMISATDADTLLGKRDAALLILGFALMGRRSELAALQISDVTETEDGLLVLIRSSKTDQDAAGIEVAIPRGVHSATDPVRVLRRYLDAMAAHGATDGPLLRSVNRHGKPGASISEDGINRAVRAAAERAGLPGAQEYSAHGLRAGGATSAYKSGAPVSAIAQQGRWSEKSTAVLGYIRAVDQWNDNPMNGVGL